ncbi:hypothetical protein JOD31_003569 [Methylopila capsulata]|uniref:Uncharacterized protein n=1 Tax=Methylopila capsulata TaxID=61654 RepID=A0ABS2TAT5_9HYPH|nr:hypothetical protein [Methylopila capsulata]
MTIEKAFRLSAANLLGGLFVLPPAEADAILGGLRRPVLAFPPLARLAQIHDLSHYGGGVYTPPNRKSRPEGLSSA